MSPPLAAKVVVNDPPTRRALVVDDDPDIRELVTEFLEQAGYEVVVARTGLRAFELLAQAPPPHLVVLDLLMPELGGHELLQRLREFPRFSAMPIVGMSAAAWRAAGAEFDSFLSKPFDAGELAEAIDAALRRRRSMAT